MANDTAIKRELKRKGWSFRRAAEALGVSYQHLYECANGNRKSRRLALKILELPQAPKFRRKYCK